MAKTFSGKEVVSILIKKFGFSLVSQKGSHVKLRKKANGKTITTTIVPLHKELARGTFLGVLELADVSEDDFRRML
jgi:predicted RNA binding protein YcfA (HicA-like mRNA interferase family)